MSGHSPYPHVVGYVKDATLGACNHSSDRQELEKISDLALSGSRTPPRQKDELIIILTCRREP